jgi:adenosylcobinamide-GDP ribazoletransferase
LAVLAQVVLVAASWQRHGAAYGAAVLAIATMTGRLAVPWGCRSGVPSARPDGLGAWVAGSVGRWPLAAASTGVAAVATAAGLVVAERGLLILWPLSVVVGVAASGSLLRHTVRRFGGITGDVLGALVETALLGALVTLAR